MIYRSPNRRVIRAACEGARWIVAIGPRPGAGLDAAGRPAHLRLTFPGLEYERANQRTAAIVVEADAGAYLLRQGVGVELVGGVGDWDVEARVIVDGEDNAPQWLWLTTFLAAAAPPPSTGPAWHTHVRRAAGALSIGGAIVDDDTPIPLATALSVGIVAVGAFQTGVRL